MTDGPKYVDLPTGKPHVSFSEIREWNECSYRHRLKFIKNIDLDKPGVHMDFGTAIHAACELFLKTRVIDKTVFMKKLHELWSVNSLVPDVKGYDVETFKELAKQGLAILPEVPTWMDETFPGWEFIDAEHQLYEPIPGHPHAFKGFIDGVIRTRGTKNKQLVWLLDWKSTSFGWVRQKRDDPMVKAQLVLYKDFWSRKMGIDPKDVRCGFVLLKRTAKPGNRCELYPVSVGEVTTKRSLTIINNMLVSMKRGIAIKNRSKCTWCVYYKTEHCP